MLTILHLAVVGAAWGQMGQTAEQGGWVLRFSDDFNRDTLHAGEIDLRPPDWRVLSGDWRVEQGMLRGTNNASISLLLRFPGDQRVEFDAVATDNICDLSAVLGTSERGVEQDGYFFGFGSELNTTSKLLIKGQEVMRHDARIVPGKVHHVICQREGGRLTHIVDGQVIATYDDPHPLMGTDHDAVAFYIYGAGKIDNVRVYTKGAGTEAAPARYAARPLRHAGGWDYRQGHRVEDPLFEELFGDAPGPTHFFHYGVIADGREKTPSGGLPSGPLWARETAKRFGFRYVLDEILDEAARYNLILVGDMNEPRYWSRGIATQGPWTPIYPNGTGELSLPDGTLPVVRDNTVWLMDPRYLGDYLVRGYEQRAREMNHWGIVGFDELWSYYVIKPVPRDKWYEQVIEADKEIREKYGFGKYGMPESHENGDPFERIAHRRWASDKLTEAFREAYKAAKQINPQMKIIGPTEGSSGTSADITAWAPYFDIMGGQCGAGPTSAYLDCVRVGAVTKAYVDLTGKPIAMMVHTAVRHAARRSPEDIRELYSQVFRNGGQGLWLMNEEWFETELTASRFAEPAKWRAMLQLTETIGNMRLPKLPEADCAILLSSESNHTIMWGQFWGWEDGSRTVSVYAVLGPLLRNWFHFVTDQQIERGSRNLNDYKVLYVPFAPYQNASVVEKIGEYANAGGTVVVTDGDAFTWNLDGELHGERWEKISGIRKVSMKDAVVAYRTVEPSPLPLPEPLALTSLTPGWNIVPLSESVRILAAFDDGSPAVTLHPYGKGKVIFFAADPMRTGEFFRIPEPLFSLATALDKEALVAPGTPVVTFIEAIQKSAGVQMGRDIWRFTLPPFTQDPWQKQTGLCLTNNYVFDVNEPLLEPNNAQTGGTYVYSRPPTGIADVGQPGEPISFNEGKLTNRLKAYETRVKDGPRWKTAGNFAEITPQWIVSWRDQSPIAITFDLKDEYPLTTFRLFFSGTMPALTVNVSSDGSTWRQLAMVEEQSAGLDVKDVVVPLSGSHRHVRLDFAVRGAGEVFELSEVELWGTPAR